MLSATEMLVELLMYFAKGFSFYSLGNKEAIKTIQGYKNLR